MRACDWVAALPVRNAAQPGESRNHAAEIRGTGTAGRSRARAARARAAAALEKVDATMRPPQIGPLRRLRGDTQEVEALA